MSRSLLSISYFVRIRNSGGALSLFPENVLSAGATATDTGRTERATGHGANVSRIWNTMEFKLILILSGRGPVRAVVWRPRIP